MPEKNKRGGWRETGEQWNQERGPEHGDHMLGADADGAPPREPLLGSDDLPRGNMLPVPVERPLQAQLLGRRNRMRVQRSRVLLSRFMGRWPGTVMRFGPMVLEQFYGLAGPLIVLSAGQGPFRRRRPMTLPNEYAKGGTPPSGIPPLAYQAVGPTSARASSTGSACGRTTGSRPATMLIRPIVRKYGISFCSE
jgi:hypothetical protein